MLRFLIVIVIILVIWFIIKNNKSRDNDRSQKIYKGIILAVIILAIIFFIATYGRFILPQIFQFVKIGLPLITKLIGI